MSDGPVIGPDGITRHHGAAIRGRRDRRELALVFTGGDFGEGCGEILDTLDRYDVGASFFLTGDFLRNRDNEGGIRRMVASGHCVGPHSDRHLLYCGWEAERPLLIDRKTFVDDLEANLAELERFGVECSGVRLWIPPYEWHNETVAGWAKEIGFPLFNFTPGTLSHADYTEEAARNFRSSETIWRSILTCAGEDPDGLNGFLLLMHLGAGPGRNDKFWTRLPELLAFLGIKGYAARTVPELLEGT